jgi:hypothetical protein
MKAFNGYEPKYQAAGGGKFEPLPPAAYVGRIYGAKADDQALTLQLDVTEGEFAQYYHKRFEADKDSPFGQKYKGMFRLNLPNGGQYDDINIRIFNSAIGAIEMSNPNYHWDWNEAGLKGKAVGINVRNKEWSYNDMEGWTTEIGRLESIPELLAGRVKVMKDRPLNKQETAATTDAQNGFTAVETSELPF